MNIVLPNIDDYKKSEQIMSSFPAEQDEVILDFKYVNFLPISYIVFLAGYARGIVQRGGIVRIHKDSIRENLFRYLQRMDFFKMGGIDFEENFVRNDPRKKFVPFKMIGVDGSINTESISTEVADCVVPEQASESDPSKTSVYDCVEYSVSELINNVIQHSDGTGYIAAQYYNKHDVVVVSVVDSGIGIKQSFYTSGSPLTNRIHDDKSALEAALEPNTSSKTHAAASWGGTENAGVGLTLLSDIARQSGGYFHVCSGNAYADVRGVRNLLRGQYSGTFSVFAFKKSQMLNFDLYLERSKINAGLTLEEESLNGIFG
ncbi:hypothetical protein [Halomonas sp. WWR20]